VDFFSSGETDRFLGNATELTTIPQLAFSLTEFRTSTENSHGCCANTIIPQVWKTIKAADE